MKSRAIIPSVLLSIWSAMQVGAADFSDPTWPCVQRKVERLSVGIMWPHPIENIQPDAATETEIKELVDRFVLRRLKLEEVAPALEKFIAAHGNGKRILGHVFAETFDRMSATRSTIMKGIEEYSLSQIALAEKIDAARAEMDKLLRADPPDYDRIDLLEEQIDWDERIYEDRRQSLIYVCETPVLLEKRLYSIAQMLLAASGG